MAKCECCGEREADRVVGRTRRGYEDTLGADYSSLCLSEPGLCARIRARRLASGLPPEPPEHDWGAASQVCNRCDRPRHQYDGTVCPGVADVGCFGVTGTQEAVRLSGVPTNAELLARYKGPAPHDPYLFEVIIAPPVTCLDCSSPVTVNGRCVYCDKRARHSDAFDRYRSDSPQNFANRRAAYRMAKSDPDPRVTASSRELAKPHPSTWPSQEGEP